jgi:AraC-like DNA-binding protein
VPPRPESSVARLQVARRFIDERFDQPIDLDLMAAQAELSRFHFVRAFRREFQTTPHRYLQALRIDRAKQLLADGDLSVTEVCFEVGFASPASFSALFRRLVGQPPVRYRRRRLFAIPALPVDGRVVFVPDCYRLRLAPAA